MVDILLDGSGDLYVSPIGDIRPIDSVRQAVQIRLRWIAGEWRLGPDLGFPWFEEVFVKKPNETKIKGLIREEITNVEGVTGAEVTDFVYDRKNRTVSARCLCRVGRETFIEEVELNAGIRAD